MASMPTRIFAQHERGGRSSAWADAFPLLLSGQRQVEEIKDKFIKDNEQASSEKCKTFLRDLFQGMVRKLSDGVYSVPGGYELFKRDQKALVEKYHEQPDKGVMADAVLQEFFEGIEPLEQIIYYTDSVLTGQEKELKNVQDLYKKLEKWEKRTTAMMAGNLVLSMIPFGKLFKFFARLL